jgi:hypothetical protein
MRYRGVGIHKEAMSDGSHFWYADIGNGLVAPTLPAIKRKINSRLARRGKRSSRSRENPLRSGQYALIGLGVVTVGLVAYGLWSKFGIQALASANQAAFASSSSGNSPTELAAYQGYASTVAPSTASPLVSPLPVVPE